MLGVFYYNVRPMELPPRTARQYVRIKEDYTEEIIHAYAGTRWLDSQRYIVIKADPAKFDDRIKTITETRWGGAAGGPREWKVRVIQGSGKELGHVTEKVPKWWDVEELPEVTAVNVGPDDGHHVGFMAIFAKDRGLIYIVDR